MTLSYINMGTGKINYFRNTAGISIETKTTYLYNNKHYELKIDRFYNRIIFHQILSFSF